MRKTHYCIDCKVEVLHNRKRCNLCNKTFQIKRMSGKNNPSYIDGRKLIKVFCKDCGKQLRHNINIRCMKCSGIELSKTRIGKNNGNYKDGRTLIKNICKDCGIEITYNSIRCKQCSDKFCVGKHTSNYKDGRCLIDKLCENCGKKIRINAKLCRQCMNKSYRGRGNPAWIDGSAYGKYSCKFNGLLKRKIRNQYNNVCQICLKKRYKKELCVHHIDYDKYNSFDDNLIPLHNSCHALTNFNRDVWYLYFLFIKEHENEKN